MTRWPILSAVLLFCILPGPVSGQVSGDLFGSSEARPGPGAYVIEGLGAAGTGFAFALLPLLGVGVAELVNNIDGNNEQAIRDWGCVTLAAYGIGSGVGAGWVGRAQGWDGRPGWTYGLAMVPPLVSAGLLYLHFNEPYSGYGRAGVILTAVGSPVLAVVGCNIGASIQMSRSRPGRFLLPSVATRMVGSPETGTSVCFDARLVSIWF